ncbi:type I secretion C-terminal target domain-containing protein (plasmid) [Rhodobacteraceae bacterium S2214]|nr:type I secretion C-terminal target domain-containing protein [Rhodobacteraceae bacterium S2214]
MEMNHEADAMHEMHAMQANGLLAPENATHTAISSGDWTDPATWSGGRVPGAEARVYIPADLEVIYNARSDDPLDTIRVDGTLSWTKTQDTKMVVETIVTGHGSRFEIGTEDSPVMPGVDAVVIFRDTPIDVASDPGQLGHGLVAFGEVDIYGASKESYLTMDGVSAGSTSVTVTGDTTNWNVGDTLLFVGTSYEGINNWTDKVLQTQDEERVITAINGNTITFDSPLSHDHMPPDGYADLDTYVANLSRNIVFASENPEGVRGHMMMHNGDTDGPDDVANIVAYAEFRDMGRTDFSIDNDDSNPLGRYSIHLHQIGAGAGEPVSEIIGNSVNGGKGWGITQHESNAIIDSNVVYDLFGAGIVSETGNEQGIWANNLVSKVVGHNERGKDNQDGLGYENNSRVIEQYDNIAANVKVGWSFIGREIFDVGTSSGDGMHRKMFERDEVQFDPSPFDVALDHQEPAITSFSGNTVLAAETGIRIYHRAFSHDSDLQSVIDDFTAWEMSGTAFDMMNYTSNYLLKDSLLIGADGAKTAFVTGVKTSAGIMNNVEVANYSTVYGVQGLAHEGMMIDVTTKNVDKLISTSHLTDIGDQYTKPIIVDSSDITPIDHVTFTPYSSADLTVTPDDLSLSIHGTTRDSLGTRVFNEYFELPYYRQISGIDAELDGGNKTYHSEFTLEEFLDLHGAVQRADGTWYSPVVNWITDRLTAEHHPVVIEIELRGFDTSLMEKYNLHNFVPPEIGNPDYDIGFGRTDEHSDADHGGHDTSDPTDPVHDPVDPTNDPTEPANDPVDDPVEEEPAVDNDPEEEPTTGNDPVVEPPVEDPADTISEPVNDVPTTDPTPDNPIIGDKDDDWMIGTPEDDYIYGDDGRDRLRGEDGDDVLDGGAGKDNIGGGSGADVFVWGMDSLGTGRDRIEDFSPEDGDVIDLTKIVAALGWDEATLSKVLKVTVSFLGTTISLKIFDEFVAIAELRDITPDQISVSAGTLRLFEEGPTGVDDGLEEPVTPIDDTPTEIDTPDPVVAEPEPVVVDVAPTPEPENTIMGSSKADWMTGTAGNDLMIGGDGNDRLRGEDGNDILKGGAGSDNLGGGLGADIFAWGPDDITDKRDRIEDFSPEEGDVIDFTEISKAYGWTAAEAEAAVSVADSYLGVIVSITIPGKGTESVAELRNMTPEQISVAAGTLRLVADETSSNSIVGTNQAEILNGTQANDIVFARAGNDVVNTGDGDDVIVGGLGADELSGGDGADTFLFMSEDVGNGRDDIQDFSVNEGDKLDFSDVLLGISAEMVDDFLQLNTSGTSSVLSIDTDGGKDSFIEVAELRDTDGLTLTDLIEADALIF